MLGPIFPSLVMFLFIVILLICILSGAEVDLFIPSLPELQKIFNLSPFWVQLTLSVNFITYCIGCLFAGALGDRFNRRHVMLMSLFIFVIGSVACFQANHFETLLIGRALQGLGMAAPAVLSYTIISDHYPLKKQIGMLGILNGMTTTAMAFAPTIGSYVNLYFNWRGNFAILLAFGVVCLVAGYFIIPNKKGEPSVSLSPLAYLPLLRSPTLFSYIAAITFIATAYWVFIGISPLLFMKDLGVTLKQFGLYQGALAGIFAIVSLLSPRILATYGQRHCFRVSMQMTVISTILIILLSLSHTNNPLIITATLMVYAVSVVFPINILYPLSLEIIPHTKARTAALIQAGRLTLTALSLQTVSYFYNGTFFNVGMAMTLFLTLSLLCIYLIVRKQWIALPAD